jgi:IS30 family transposase
MPRSYVQLNLEDRRKLARFRDRKMPADEIADRLGKDRSTIFRELRRNHFHDPEIPAVRGYFAVTAHDMAKARRARQRKLVRNPALCAAVVDRLEAVWSPEQIAGRLQIEANPHRICHETIYRFAYSKEGQSREIYRHLPEHRRRRRPRNARRRQGRRFSNELSISRRPEIVAARQEFGHWESDLMMFRKEYGKSNVTSLVERVSRFTVLLKNKDRQSRPIMNALIASLAPLPREARRSITFDRGTEFTAWSQVQSGLGAQTWFCDPQSPWQKGTVENTNGRARRHLPREADPTAVTDHHLRMICDRLNTTPRKCLGFRTPAETFRDKLLEGVDSLS